MDDGQDSGVEPRTNQTGGVRLILPTTLLKKWGFNIL